MPPNPVDEVALAERLARIEQGVESLRVYIEQEVKGLRSDLSHYFAQLADHEARLRIIEREQSIHDTQIKAHEGRIGSLSNRVNAWGATNSLGAALAAVLAWFR